jgi:transposase
MKEPDRIDLPESKANELIQRLEQGRLEPEDYRLLARVVRCWLWLSKVVQDSRISIKELKKLIFGAKTEKTSKVLKKAATQDASASKPPKDKPKGHGRNGAEDYAGAERVAIACSELCTGDRCPKCQKGTVGSHPPSVMVCVTGQAPIQGKIYELETLRCNLCGALFRDRTPEDAQGPKYDPSAGSMMAVLHYACGMPFNRLADLQRNLGIPLPSSTQWDVINDLSNNAHPAFESLCHHAAEAGLFHNDDTKGRILELEKQIAKELEAARANGKEKDCRTGVFTTGIVSEVQGRKVALFFTGRKHAGENLAELLDKRDAQLPPPIQMCDALSRNAPKGFQRLLANCLCHGRREFVKLIEDFPDKCAHVLETLREIYKNDAIAKDQGMSNETRLAFHQDNSQPIMETFFDWLNTQLDEKRVEPNSRMGEAISYLINHWEALTLFLRVPGAPLDNNICERSLKIPIRYRHNSLFFKTEHGAMVGDMLMSLIHTCRLNGINALEYLTAIGRHAQRVKATPADWLPWNYHHALPVRASP